MRLGRLDESGERTAMNTDTQVELELPRVRDHIDKLQGTHIFHVKKLFFRNKALRLRNNQGTQGTG